MKLENKIFCVGFHRTGTCSLRDALEILGYKVCGPVWKIDERLVRSFDAFQDMPWPLYYELLDQKCQNSKFILTIRNSESWINSCIRKFGGKKIKMHEIIYGGAGNPIYDEDRWIKKYEQNNESILEYFKDRPDDLLVLRITQGEGWEKLCPFLGHKIPNEDFPHVAAKPQSTFKT